MGQESSTPPSAIGICLTIAALLLSLTLATWLWLQGRRSSLLPSKPRTVEQVLTALGPVVEGRIRPAFDRARVKWPPRPLTLLALKAERRLEVYAVADTGEPHLTLEYPILAASGTSGPKDRGFLSRRVAQSKQPVSPFPASELSQRRRLRARTREPA